MIDDVYSYGIGVCRMLNMQGRLLKLRSILKLSCYVKNNWPCSTNGRDYSWRYDNPPSTRLPPSFVGKL